MTGRQPTDRTAARATPPGRLVGRRSLLLGGLLALGGTASACGSAETAAPPAAPPSPTSARTPSPSPSSSAPPPPPPPPPEPLLADVPAYALLPGEVEPACKDAAVAFVTAVLTAGTPSTASAPLEQRLAALGQPVAAAAPLLDLLPVGGASALEVVYPQYGGLTAERDEASVMLVADQLVVPGGADTAVQRRSTTVDVRLRTEGGAWRVTEVRPAVLPAAAPSPSAPVQALLGTDRVVLPAAARADLLGGGVHDAVATALLELSARWRVHVQVLTGGHPVNVWDTDRTSNHTRGRAVDVWALDGVPVVDQAACPWEELVLAGSAAGASEVGGPRGAGVKGFFTDQVHQDHVHLGFGRA